MKIAYKIVVFFVKSHPSTAFTDIWTLVLPIRSFNKQWWHCKEWQKNSLPMFIFTNVYIYSRLSRSCQLGGCAAAFRLGYPPRYKANKEHWHIYNPAYHSMVWKKSTPLVRNSMAAIPNFFLIQTNYCDYPFVTRSNLVIVTNPRPFLLKKRLEDFTLSLL